MITAEELERYRELLDSQYYHDPLAKSNALAACIAEVERLQKENGDLKLSNSLLESVNLLNVRLCKEKDDEIERFKEERHIRPMPGE